VADLGVEGTSSSSSSESSSSSSSSSSSPILWTIGSTPQPMRWANEVPSSISLKVSSLISIEPRVVVVLDGLELKLLELLEVEVLTRFRCSADCPVGVGGRGVTGGEIFAVNTERTCKAVSFLRVGRKECQIECRLRKLVKKSTFTDEVEVDEDEEADEEEERVEEDEDTMG